jgi:UDP-N-acetylmuramate dehydrogenase
MELQECALGYRDSIFKRDDGVERVVVGLTLKLPRRWRAVTGYAELERELQACCGGEPGPRDVFDAVCALRRRKLPDPLQIGNAGSFFKNPIVSRARHTELLTHFPSMVSYPLAGGRCKLGAGWLIEACGLKGCTRGRAGVFERQALVLVNRGGAAGREILELAREVQARVLEKFGIALEPEVRIA